MEIVIIGAAEINNYDLLNRVASTRASSILVEVSSRWNYIIISARERELADAPFSLYSLIIKMFV